MKKIALSIVLILSFVGGIQAQVSSKQEKIKNLLELSGSGKLGAQMANYMVSRFKENYKTVPEEFWNEFSKEISSEELIKLTIPIYDKYYTEDDIDKLIVFYNSPIGKKLIATMPQVLQESMSVGKSWGEEISKKAIDRLKEKGYFQDNK